MPKQLVFALIALGLAGCVKSSEGSRHNGASPPAAEKPAPVAPQTAPEQAPVAARRFWPLTRITEGLAEPRTSWHEPRSQHTGAYQSAYSRVLKVVYLERSFRWQSRHLISAMQRDLGLHFRGWYDDAQEGWQQPVSIYPDAAGKFPAPLRLPHLARESGVDSAWLLESEAIDLLVLGDNGPQASTKLDWSMISRFVLDGGGLVLLPGKEMLAHALNPEFRLICPVVPDYRSSVEDEANTESIGFVCATPDGASHDLLNLAADEEGDARLLGSDSGGLYKRGTFDGIFWVAPVVSVRPGAQTLAVVVQEGHDVKSGAPMLVVHKVGRGRVVWVGTDDLWMWRQYVGDIYFYQFFQNVIRWAANDPGPG